MLSLAVLNSCTRAQCACLRACLAPSLMPCPRQSLTQASSYTCSPHLPAPHHQKHTIRKRGRFPPSLLHVVGVLPAQHDALQDGRQRLVLLRAQLRALARVHEHGRVVRLEARDGLGAARLRHDVDRLAHAAGHRQQLALLVERHEHAGRHGGGQAVQQVVLLAPNGGLDVQPRHQHRQQPRQRHAAQQLPVGVVGVQPQQALAHVHKTLRDAHHEQLRGVLVVVGREVAQHARQARVVGARAHEAQRQDGGARHLAVQVVAQPRQRVQHQDLGVADVEQRQRQRYGALDSWLAVLQRVLQRAPRHGDPQRLRHGHQCQAQHGSTLVRRLPAGALLRRALYVLARHRQELLHLEHVAGARVRAPLQAQRREARHAVAQRLDHLARRLRLVLLAQEQQAQAQAQLLGRGGGQLHLAAAHERLQHSHHNLLPAAAGEHQAQRQRSAPRHLQGHVGVSHQGHQQLRDLIAL
mmetsp:Transcript_15417/g.38392  ORF Transcript_15417/g.38392 Transcript_15417/m.38392 type:complete len:468 (-) Transcript_15417:1687-3090(-)